LTQQWSCLPDKVSWVRCLSPTASSPSPAPITPAVLYGLNYFSSPSEFTVVRTPGEEREVIRHITNNGKYPFCYQPLGEGDEVVTATAIFGKSIDKGPEVEAAAAGLYAEFRIPLMTMVFIRTSRGYRLSSLAPTRYSSLSAAEKAPPVGLHQRRVLRAGSASSSTGGLSRAQSSSMP
jgi:hypothetical protein